MIMQNFQAQRTLLQNSPPRGPFLFRTNRRRFAGGLVSTHALHADKIVDLRTTGVSGGIYAFMERPEANGRKRPLRHNGDSVGNERRTFAGLVRVASDGRSTRRRFAGSDRQQPGDQKNIETDDIFYFVATFIPDPTCARERQGSETSLSVYDGSAIQRIRSDFRRDGRICYGFLHRNGSHCQVHLRIPESEQPTDSSEVTDRLRLATPGRN